MSFYGTDANDNEFNNPEFVQYGGGGNDALGKNNAPFRAYGGDGNDSLYQNGDFYMDAWGGYGNDFLYVQITSLGHCYLHGDEGEDVILGGNGVDYIEGGQGRDALSGNGGNDTIYGGDGDDNSAFTITAGTGASGVTETRKAGLFGRAGDDYLDGGRGADTLDGGDDADTLLGGEGNDTLDGGTGVDRMSGGAGNDTFYVDSAADKVTEAAGDGIDTVYTRASYTLAAGQSVETLATIDATATTAINLTGNELSQRILGNAGTNVIVAGDGADAIYGYGGRDDIRGGTGADSFLFTRLTDSTVAATGRDFIRDFSHAQNDKIDLRTLDANTTVAGNQAFTFIGAGAFTNKAGELRTAAYGTAYTIVSGDVNGDATADFSILVNKTAFVAGDFLL